MVNKKNVSLVRMLKLENGDLNLSATIWGEGMRRSEWPRRQIRKIRFTTGELVGQQLY